MAVSCATLKLTEVKRKGLGMPRAKSKWDRTVHQVVWEDLRPWVEQLWKGYGVLVAFSVTMLPDDSKVQHAVRMVASHKSVGSEKQQEETDYRYFNTDEVGAVESKALMMISRLLLDLENEKAAAEERQGSLWR